MSIDGKNINELDSETRKLLFSVTNSFDIQNFRIIRADIKWRGPLVVEDGDFVYKIKDGNSNRRCWKLVKEFFENWHEQYYVSTQFHENWICEKFKKLPGLGADSYKDLSNPETELFRKMINWLEDEIIRIAINGSKMKSKRYPTQDYILTWFDPNIWNIIYDEKQDKFTLIDFDQIDWIGYDAWKIAVTDIIAYNFGLDKVSKKLFSDSIQKKLILAINNDFSLSSGENNNVR